MRADATPKHRSASDAVYGDLQDRLMKLQVLPGERLTVDVLARELQVSPTPVREALARLEAEGLVTKTFLRGYRAAPQSTTDELRAMFEVRLLLEPFAAASAATSKDHLLVPKLRDLQQEMERAATNKELYQVFAALDAAFHSCIVGASANTCLADAVSRLHTHLHLFRLHRDSGITAPALVEHARIVEAIELHDADLAEGAMRSHLRRSVARVESLKA